MRNGWGWLLCALLLLAGWLWWHGRPIARADGMLAPNDPVQTDFDTPPPAIPFKDATLHPLANFSLTARVLSRDDYHFDAEADLSPTDLAFGWGTMSDSAVLRAIDISQSGRFYYWQTRAFPVPRREIETHSANMHMIPADASVEYELKRVRVGDVVSLDGMLVEADKANGWRWRSSLTRDDTGDGACELVYVQSLTIQPR
ncbi:MAG TPA: hypothetical protein VN662_09040 [Rhodanobacteraceae bacterium]|nr:hypothetical protein [Rhodanobacteraceae bacterium]